MCDTRLALTKRAVLPGVSDEKAGEFHEVSYIGRFQSTQSATYDINKTPPALWCCRPHL